MKWVKISERLPEAKGIYFVKRNDLVSKGLAHFNNDRTSNQTYWKTEIVEWLDESESPSPMEQDAVRFGDWLRENEWHPLPRGQENKWFKKLFVSTQYQTTAQLYQLFITDKKE